MSLVWCEIDDRALAANAMTFRQLIGPEVRLAMTVKANAYGHGLLESAAAFIAGGADWLCVHTLTDAQTLRESGIDIPIYIMGPIALSDLHRLKGLHLRIVVYNKETVDRLIDLGVEVKLHLKLETGNNRQGIPIEDALRLAKQISVDAPNLELEGLCSHFANIEDTTDHRYARQQLARFADGIVQLEAHGHSIAIRHLSNSAAAILWPDQAMDMVRVGIAGYGLWPSKETKLAASLVGRSNMALRPALTWKTRIAQIKNISAGEYVGYGCSFMTSRPSRIAILPVGYFDGYDRGLSNLAHVLCHGQRAPVRGRICMNIIMIDVTDIPQVALEDPIVLLGRQGSEEITAEQLAEWAGTINYEVVSRIAMEIPRKRVNDASVLVPADVSYRAPNSG